MINFFDTHLHIKEPTDAAFDQLISMLESIPTFMGGLLILNTAKEIDIIARNIQKIPSSIGIVPFWKSSFNYPNGIDTIGWYKIHPVIQKIDIAALPDLITQLERRKPTGVIVHCYPWGSDLEYNTSLPLVIKMAKALPDTIILVTHGGGYESWAFRAHTGGFTNVHYDFSMTLDYYEKSDILKPLQRYMKYSSSRIHFGSDWPSGRIEQQLQEMLRLGNEVGLSDKELENILLTNASLCWPSLISK